MPAGKNKKFASDREKAWEQAILFLCSELLDPEACDRVQGNPPSNLPMLPGEKEIPVKLLDFEKRLFLLSDQIGRELERNPELYSMKQADQMIRVGHILRELLWASMAVNHPHLPQNFGVRNGFTVVEVDDRTAEGIFGRLFDK